MLGILEKQVEEINDSSEGNHIACLVQRWAWPVDMSVALSSKLGIWIWPFRWFASFILSIALEKSNQFGKVTRLMLDEFINVEQPLYWHIGLQLWKYFTVYSILL